RWSNWTWRTSRTRAFSTHGKSSWGRKYSLSCTQSQMPWAEMLVTSTWEVRSPSLDDFIAMFLNHFLHGGQLLACQAVILRQRHARLNPKLRLAIAAI